MADWVVPRSWTRLDFWDQLERRRDSRDGLVVILDSATASLFHHSRCEHVAEPHFEAKRRNDWRNGACYWIEMHPRRPAMRRRAVCGGLSLSDAA